MKFAFIVLIALFIASFVFLGISFETAEAGKAWCLPGCSSPPWW